MAHEIAGICHCRLCAAKFTGPTGLIIQPGAAQNGRVAQYMQDLAGHIITAHPVENKNMELQALEYLGLQRMTLYSTTDKAIMEQRDFLRWKIHQSTLAHRLSDGQMDAASKEFAAQFVDDALNALVTKPIGQDWPEHVKLLRSTLVAAVALKLYGIIEDFRRLIEEPGKYQLQVVTAPGTGSAAPKPS